MNPRHYQSQVQIVDCIENTDIFDVLAGLDIREVSCPFCGHTWQDMPVDSDSLQDCPCGVRVSVPALTLLS